MVHVWCYTRVVCSIVLVFSSSIDFVHSRNDFFSQFIPNLIHNWWDNHVRTQLNFNKETTDKRFARSEWPEENKISTPLCKASTLWSFSIIGLFIYILFTQLRNVLLTFLQIVIIEKFIFEIRVHMNCMIARVYSKFYEDGIGGG